MYFFVLIFGLTLGFKSIESKAKNTRQEESLESE
jgi:hypothetical protein